MCVCVCNVTRVIVHIYELLRICIGFQHIILMNIVMRFGSLETPNGLELINNEIRRWVVVLDYMRFNGTLRQKIIAKDFIIKNNNILPISSDYYFVNSFSNLINVLLLIDVNNGARMKINIVLNNYHIQN